MLRLPKFVRWLLYGIGVWLVCYVVLVLLFRPSHDRVWQLGHEMLPHIVYSATSSLVTIENYRDFDWSSTVDADVQYVTRTFDLDQLTGVDVFISHFAEFEGMAHIFISFGFAGGERAVISLETRREADETFSPLLGMLRQYEIIYVVGSEEDIVGVRTEHRDERVYLYPTKSTPEQARQLFDLLAEDINQVYEQPRMYNTLLHNCTNELTRPVEEMSEVNFPITWKTILPGYFDEVLYDLGLIKNDTPFTVVKEQHYIDNQSVDPADESYSAALRSGIPEPNFE